jgi:hypothetical protein
MNDFLLNIHSIIMNFVPLPYETFGLSKEAFEARAGLSQGRSQKMVYLCRSSSARISERRGIGKAVRWTVVYSHHT